MIIHFSSQCGNLGIILLLGFLREIIINKCRNVKIAVSEVPQCGNFRIFLSLRFYVKSILENLEVLKLLGFVILGALNYVNVVDFSLEKYKKS